MRKFKSLLFADATGLNDDPDLVACLERDSAHIGPGAVGGPVAKIQIVLSKVEGAALTTENGTYGDLTTTAVKKYKDSPKRRLLQPGQLKADEFVGKRTIRSLDDEMFKAENPGPSPAPTPTPVNPAKLSGATLARLDVPLALQKVNAAIRKLKEFKGTLNLRLGPIVRIQQFDKITENALRTHFRLIAFDAPAPPNAGATGRGFPRRPIRMDDVDHLILHFAKIQTLFVRNATSFTDGAPVDKAGNPVAAAAFLDSGTVIFGSPFRNFTDTQAQAIGPNSRAAVLIHEGFHAVDTLQRSGDDLLTHISEFDSRYDTQGANDSIFNPSSFASFAAHVFKGSDPKPRFGLGPGARGL